GPLTLREPALWERQRRAWARGAAPWWGWNGNGQPTWPAVTEITMVNSGGYCAGHGGRSVGRQRRHAGQWRRDRPGWPRGPGAASAPKRAAPPRSARSPARRATRPTATRAHLP